MASTREDHDFQFEGTLSHVLTEYRDWMLRHTGVTPSTIDVYQRALAEVLRGVGDDTSRYTPALVRKFFLDRKDLGRGWFRNTTTALRSFLRHRIVKGSCPPGLDATVPRAAHWRLSALPRALSAEAIKAVLDSPDPAARCGFRDEAVLLLLARLGLRASDVAGLRFTDVDWSQGTLRLCGKGRRESLLPLPQDVGEALLAYIERGRPAHADARIFLTAIAPYRPLASKGVSGIVRTAIQRAGITDAPSRGSHVLRHSAATAMLRSGASLAGIAEVLRHRSTETTTLYAKVDLVLLTSIAQPWPEVMPC